MGVRQFIRRRPEWGYRASLLPASAWDTALGFLFIPACAWAVGKTLALEFDRYFYVSAAAGALILLISRHRLGFIAVAFA